MKRYSLIIRGREHEWSFDVLGKPDFVAAWGADGLIVDEIVNIVPAWAVDLGLMRIWCFMQDIFYFKNPFKKIPPID